MAETQTTTATPQTTEPAAQEQSSAVQQPAAGTETAQPEGHKPTDFDTVVQRAVDRATNKLGNENKKLREEIEKLKKAGMDADELKNFELSEKEKEIADRERALTEKENRLTAIKAIKEAGLDDGSDASLAIVDFVMADTEDGIRDRVQTLNSLVEKIVKAKVDGVFRANGRTPGIGSDSAANAGGQNDSFAARMGRNAANTNKAAQAVLNHYIGGNKE